MDAGRPGESRKEVRTRRLAETPKVVTVDDIPPAFNAEVLIAVATKMRQMNPYPEKGMTAVHFSTLKAIHALADALQAVGTDQQRKPALLANLCDTCDHPYYDHVEPKAYVLQPCAVGNCECKDFKGLLR